LAQYTLDVELQVDVRNAVSTRPRRHPAIRHATDGRTDRQTSRPRDTAGDLDVFVGVEEHNGDECEHFLGNTVTRSCKVRQRLGDGSHLIQLHLDTADQRQVPVTS